MITVRRPETTAELDDVRALMRAFVAWHRERHVEDLALIDEYFDQNEFEDELASLPGKYTPPDGQLFLACNDDKPAGCVALRIDPYYDCPPALKEWLVFFELRL
jgi:hypothetical protein